VSVEPGQLGGPKLVAVSIDPEVSTIKNTYGLSGSPA
jgi:hypothetical protein